MEARPGLHDTTQKTFLGQTLPPNRSITQDLDGALDIIFNHPNVGPFVATRLIRALVTSNPSPAYIARIAAVFNDNGQGVRGDLQATVRAILLDPEARNDAPPANFGKLKSPMLYYLSFQRAMQSSVPTQTQTAYLYYTFGEGMLDPASVFGHYSPLYRIPKTTLYGPEFQIYSPTEAINRDNYLYQFVNNYGGGSSTPFIGIAGDPVQLVNAVDNALLFGRMSQTTRNSIYKALQASTDPHIRAVTALYLTATSGEYLVQH
jgi:DNA-binding phage protein